MKSAIYVYSATMVNLRVSVTSCICSFAGYSHWAQKRIVSRTRPEDFTLTDVEWNNDAGTGSTVSVVDSGVYADHQEFQGKEISTYTADRLARTEGNTDLYGHGTHTAALIAGGAYGIAKATSVTSLKACDRKGECTEFDIIEVLTWAYLHENRRAGRNIILINLKSEHIGSGLCEMLKVLSEDDFIVVISTGRYVTSTCLAPLWTSDHVVLVGATDMGDRVATFSRPGKVDMFAPGVGIESAWIGSRDAKLVLSGNSPSAALVAGSLAGYAGHFSGSQPTVTMRKWLMEHTLPVETVSPTKQTDVIPFLYVPYLLIDGRQDNGTRGQPVGNSDCEEGYIIAAVIIAFLLALTVVGVCAYCNRTAKKASQEMSPACQTVRYNNSNNNNHRLEFGP